MSKPTTNKIPARMSKCACCQYHNSSSSASFGNIATMLNSTTTRQRSNRRLPDKLAILDEIAICTVMHSKLILTNEVADANLAPNYTR